MTSGNFEVPNPFLNSLKEVDDYEKLYPEIAAAGRLGIAISHSFKELGGALTAQDDYLSPFYATFAQHRRSVSISVAIRQRVFFLHFWAKGVQMADLGTRDFNELILSIKLWLVDKVNLRAMQEQLWEIKVLERAYEYEAGRGVDAQWNLLLSAKAADFLGPLLPLVQSASKQPLLRQLFPFQNMAALRFSRTTGQPYTADLPFAVVTGKGNWSEVAKNPLYRAYKPDGTLLGQGTPETLLGEGTPEEVIEMITRSLPKGIGPAVDATADDLIKPN